MSLGFTSNFNSIGSKIFILCDTAQEFQASGYGGGYEVKGNERREIDRKEEKKMWEVPN